MTQGLILVVEDDSTQRRAYVEALKARGFQVVGASTGEEASRLLPHYKPRLVILDVNLPGIGGAEVCRRIRRQLDRGVTVIFITSNDSLDVLQECIAAGGDDFLIKGVSIKGVLERVGYWMQAPSRSLQPAQRDSILRNVRSALGQDALARSPGADMVPERNWRSLAPQNDEALATMVRFITEARARAPDGFGRTVEQKLYLLGYIAGVVNIVANSSMMLKIRFLDYLKATLHSSDVLDMGDVDELVDSWHTFYGQTTFETGGKRGEVDFHEWRHHRALPQSLGEFARTQTNC